MRDLNMTTVALGLTVSLGLGGQAMAQTECGSVDILFNKYHGANHPFFVTGLDPWAEEIGRLTDGRVTVNFTAASLAPVAQQWTMVADGVADAAVLGNSVEVKRLQLPNLAALPFTGSLATVRSLALWRTQQEYFSDGAEYDGVHLISQFTNAGAGIMANTVVSGMQDLEGLKLWSAAGQGAQVVDSIGAVPVPAPGSEMFNMYSKGVVDGIVADWGAMKVSNSFRYTKSFVDIPGGLYASAFSVIMNQDKWNSICPSDQELISSISGETIARNIGTAIDDLGKAAQAESAEYDITIVDPDEAFTASLKEATKFSHDAWIEEANARGVDGEAALAYFLQQVKDITEDKLN